MFYILMTLRPQAGRATVFSHRVVHGPPPQKSPGVGGGWEQHRLAENASGQAHPETKGPKHLWKQG